MISSLCHFSYWSGSEFNTIFTSFLSVISNHLKKVVDGGLTPEENEDHVYFLLIAT